MDLFGAPPTTASDASSLFGGPPPTNSHFSSSFGAPISSNDNKVFGSTSTAFGNNNNNNNISTTSTTTSTTATVNQSMGTTNIHLTSDTMTAGTIPNSFGSAPSTFPFTKSNVEDSQETSGSFPFGHNNQSTTTSTNVFDSSGGNVSSFPFGNSSTAAEATSSSSNNSSSSEIGKPPPSSFPFGSVAPPSQQKVGESAPSITEATASTSNSSSSSSISSVFGEAPPSSFPFGSAPTATEEATSSSSNNSSSGVFGEAPPSSFPFGSAATTTEEATSSSSNNSSSSVFGEAPPTSFPFGNSSKTAEETSSSSNNSSSSSVFGEAPPTSFPFGSAAPPSQQEEIKQKDASLQNKDCAPQTSFRNNFFDSKPPASSTSNSFGASQTFPFDSNNRSSNYFGSSKNNIFNNDSHTTTSDLFSAPPPMQDSLPTQQQQQQQTDTLPSPTTEGLEEPKQRQQTQKTIDENKIEQKTIAKEAKEAATPSTPTSTTTAPLSSTTPFSVSSMMQRSLIVVEGNVNDSQLDDINLDNTDNEDTPTASPRMSGVVNSFFDGDKSVFAEASNVASTVGSALMNTFNPFATEEEVDTSNRKITNNTDNSNYGRRTEPIDSSDEEEYENRGYSHTNQEVIQPEVVQPEVVQTEVVQTEVVQTEVVQLQVAMQQEVVQQRQQQQATEWQMIQDPNSGYYYWWNDRLQQSTWDDPTINENIQQQQQQQKEEVVVDQQQSQEVKEEVKGEVKENVKGENNTIKKHNVVQQWVLKSIKLTDMNSALNAFKDISFEECYEMLEPAHSITPTAQFMFLGFQNSSDIRIIMDELRKRKQHEDGDDDIVNNTKKMITTTNDTTNTTISNNRGNNSEGYEKQIQQLKDQLLVSSMEKNAMNEKYLIMEKKYTTLSKQYNMNQKDATDNEKKINELMNQVNALTLQYEKEHSIRIKLENDIKLNKLNNQNGSMNKTSSLQKELDIQRNRLKIRRQKLEEDEKNALERSFAVNEELMKMREELEEEQHRLKNDQIQIEKLKKEHEILQKKFINDQKIYEESKQKEVSQMATTTTTNMTMNEINGMSPITSTKENGVGEHTPLSLMFASRVSLGSIIRIPDRDADVSQEADELLNVLDRLIAETKGAMTDGMTPIHSSEDCENSPSRNNQDTLNSSELSSPSAATAEKGATTAELGDPRRRIMNSIGPVLVQRNGQKADMVDDASSDATLKQAVEQLQAALKYRDTYETNGGSNAMMNKMKITMESKLKTVVSDSSSSSKNDSGRSKRLERALIAMWQLYGDSKDGGRSSANSTPSRHKLNQQHEYQPSVRDGGNQSLISISDFRLPSTPFNSHHLNDSITSETSSNASTPVNWAHVQSLVEQTGEQMAVQQSRFEEKILNTNKAAEEKIKSKFCLYV